MTSLSVQLLISHNVIINVAFLSPNSPTNPPLPAPCTNPPFSAPFQTKEQALKERRFLNLPPGVYRSASAHGRQRTISRTNHNRGNDFSTRFRLALALSGVKSRHSCYALENGACNGRKKAGRGFVTLFIRLSISILGRYPPLYA